MTQKDIETLREAIKQARIFGCDSLADQWQKILDERTQTKEVGN